MPKISIDRDRCKGCLLCMSFCLRGLIWEDENLNERGVRPVKFSRLPLQQDPAISGKKREGEGNENTGCLGCAMCAIICPDCCIEVYK
jgi:2-oxoglutarate ferredoxin oxidoreductase subunit delta